MTKKMYAIGQLQMVLTLIDTSIKENLQIENPNMYSEGVQWGMIVSRETILNRINALQNLTDGT